MGDPSQRVSSLIGILAEVCRQDASAHCLLLCTRGQLRDPDSFHGHAWTKDPDPALRRVHIKYCSSPTEAQQGPTLVELLAALQNLSFQPTLLAVLDPSEMIDVQLGLRGLFLALALLVDAAAQGP